MLAPCQQRRPVALEWSIFYMQRRRRRVHTTHTIKRTDAWTFSAVSGILFRVYCTAYDNHTESA